MVERYEHLRSRYIISGDPVKAERRRTLLCRMPRLYYYNCRAHGILREIDQTKPVRFWIRKAFILRDGCRTHGVCDSRCDSKDEYKQKNINVTIPDSRCSKSRKDFHMREFGMRESEIKN